MGDSKRWLREHFNDPYVKKAQQEGYPSRAAYKLLELQDRDHFLKPGLVVLDLGAAPGGWSMVARHSVGVKGYVVAVDILPMVELSGVEYLRGDLTEPETIHLIKEKVQERTNQAQVDLVISDMAPNMSGNRSIDQPRAMYLLEMAWEVVQTLLRPGGCFVTKIFQGAGVDVLIKEWRIGFESVKIRKPNASRARSSEVYLVASGFKKSQNKIAQF